MVDYFNVWYDELKEPKRFGIFMAIMMISVALLQVGFSLNNGPMMVIGLVNTMIVTYIACIRALCKGGNHRYVSYAMIGGLTLIALGVVVLILF